MFIKALNTSRTCGIVCGLLCTFGRLPSHNCLYARMSMQLFNYFQRGKEDSGQLLESGWTEKALHATPRELPS